MRIGKLTLLLVSICFSLILPMGELMAQAGGFTGAFSRIGFGPRGMAMGNAMTGTHQNGAYGYYNPALAATPNDFIQVDLSSSAMTFDRQLHMASAQFQLPPSAGISVAILNGRIGDIDGRSQSGYHTEMLSTSEYQMITNFGIRFTETFWGGVGIKVNLSDYHPEVSSETSIGLDAGFYKQAGRVGIGFAVQDLFAKTNYDTSTLFGSNTGGARSNDYPTRIKLGGSYTYSSELLFTADYEIRVLTSEVQSVETTRIEGRPITETVRTEVTTNTQILRLGGSYDIHSRITLRTGLQVLDLNQDDINLQPSAGFSLHLPFDRWSPAIDYAFVREPSNISTMHVFSIRLQI